MKLRIFYKFCQKLIKPDNQKIIENLQKIIKERPSIQLFSWINNDHVEQIYSYIQNNRFPPSHLINLYHKLEEVIPANTNQQLISLLKIKCDKANIYKHQKMIIQANKEAEQALKILGLIDSIDPILASHTYRLAASIQIQSQQFLKASNNLLSAEAILQINDVEDVRDKNYSLAQIYSNLALVNFQLQKIEKSLANLQISNEYWDKLQAKLKYPQYGKHTMLSCTILQAIGQINQAINVAQLYVQHADKHSKIWLLSLFDRHKTNYNNDQLIRILKNQKQTLNQKQFSIFIKYLKLRRQTQQKINQKLSQIKKQ